MLPPTVRPCLVELTRAAIKSQLGDKTFCASSHSILTAARAGTILISLFLSSVRHLKPVEKYNAALSEMQWLPAPT